MAYSGFSLRKAPTLPGKMQRPTISPYDLDPQLPPPDYKPPPPRLSPPPPPTNPYGDYNPFYEGFRSKSHSRGMSLPLDGLMHSVNRIANQFPKHMESVAKVSSKLIYDAEMLMRNSGLSRVRQHTMDGLSTLSSSIGSIAGRSGMASPPGSHIPIAAYGIQPPAMDYRDNYWIPPYEIPVEPNYFPGYNIVSATPRNGYYNPAGSYPSIML